MSKVIVVGGGLFGATIARALQREGHTITVFDDKRPLSGSAPSACLMKPGWFAGLGKGVTVPALDMLDDLYGIQDLSFTVWPSKKAKVHWVPSSQILNLDDLFVIDATVTKIGQGWVRADIPDMHGRLESREYEADKIIVAAGYWCQQLIPRLTGLVGKQGISFRWKTPSVGNTINPWAPYKQTVIFQEEPGAAWGGDGSAIKPENWTAEREVQCSDRVEKAAKCVVFRERTSIVGIRPYIKGHKPCYLEEVRPGTWCVTGGAKNGTVAAGWAAHQLGRELA